MKGLGVSFLVVIFAGALFQCEAPCTRTVSQSEISAVNQAKLASDIEEINTYLANNAITAIADPSGIRYTIDVQGSGSMPCLENSVTVKYTGRFMSNGAVFDSSTSAVSFGLGNLILGWRIMLPKIQQGSKVKLYIPSGFAYGPSGTTGIPANSNLIFEIELIK